MRIAMRFVSPPVSTLLNSPRDSREKLEERTPGRRRAQRIRNRIAAERDPAFEGLSRRMLARPLAIRAHGARLRWHNALVAARDMTGVDDIKIYALPHAEVRAMLNRKSKGK